MTNRFFTCNWRFLRVAVPIVAFLAPHAGSAFETLQQSPASATWLTAWGTSQQALGTTIMTNATVRMIARVTVPGEAVRVRLDNTFGTGPRAIGKAYVGQRTRGAALVPGSNRQLFFNRSASASIPPGGSVVSDPVAIAILGGQDLAVSLHIPQANVRPRQHSSALVTSYSSPDGSGDVAADEAGTPLTEIRQTVNQWIRSRASFDGVIDFDEVVLDPANPDRIYAPFNCDDIHPTPLGYFEMGKSVSLGLFGSGPARGRSR